MSAPRAAVLGLLCLLCLLCLLGATALHAQPARVTMELSREHAWSGQRVPFFISLRAGGPFVGTAQFDLPQLPGVLLLKIGAPVLGTCTGDSGNCFVQTHEFALFAQRAGPLDLPPIAVRFASRERFDGPALETQGKTTPVRIVVQRPPGSEGLAFVATTPELAVSESWDPDPAQARVGTVLTRRIVQRASDLPAMALSPPPAATVTGVRIYVAEPQARDRLERGEFLGERQDTLSYLLQRPGRVTLPAIDYLWWNPDTATLDRATLPALAIEVQPADGSIAAGRRAQARLWWLAAALAVLSLALLQRGRAARWRVRVAEPERHARRALRRACARDDAQSAWTAWERWLACREGAIPAEAALRAEATVLEACLFGRTAPQPWQGAALLRALDAELRAARRAPGTPQPSALPPLNPRDAAERRRYERAPGRNESSSSPIGGARKPL